MSNMLVPGCCCEEYCICESFYDGELFLKITIADLAPSYTFPGGSPGPYTITGMDAMNGVYLSKAEWPSGDCLGFRFQSLDVLRSVVNSQFPRNSLIAFTFASAFSGGICYFALDAGFASSLAPPENSARLIQSNASCGPSGVVDLRDLDPLPAPVSSSPYVRYQNTDFSTATSSYQFTITYEYAIL